MYQLQEKDPNTWQFFSNGNFSVNKSKIPLSAIGADHALEQEKCQMKVHVLYCITGV